MKGPNQPQAPPAGLNDGLALWEQEASAGPSALSAVRLDANEHFLVPFTPLMKRVEAHYMDSDAVRGYVHCNGPDCVLCRVGRQHETRDLWPVYDVVERAVGVLPVSSSLRPHSLRPQLAAVLRQLKVSTKPLLLSVRRDGYRYCVATSPLPEGAEDGAAAIQSFRTRFEAGQTDLGCVYPRVANEDLAAVPEIRAAMAVKGVKL